MAVKLFQVTPNSNNTKQARCQWPLTQDLNVLHNRLSETEQRFEK